MDVPEYRSAKPKIDQLASMFPDDGTEEVAAIIWLAELGRRLDTAMMRAHEMIVNADGLLKTLGPSILDEIMRRMKLLQEEAATPSRDFGRGYAQAISDLEAVMANIQTRLDLAAGVDPLTET